MKDEGALAGGERQNGIGGLESGARYCLGRSEEATAAGLVEVNPAPLPQRTGQALWEGGGPLQPAHKVRIEPTHQFVQLATCLLRRFEQNVETTAATSLGDKARDEGSKVRVTVGIGAGLGVDLDRLELVGQKGSPFPAA
jgi:hypothetical protein